MEREELPVNRHIQLDSLRGMAALSVLFGHYLLIFPAIEAVQSNNTLINIFKYSPLHIVWAGHAAVILFFVLSGYVLSLPFHKNGLVSYKNFIIKRILRIYPPYFVAIMFALFLRLLIPSPGITAFSDWFNRIWTSPITLNAVIKHIILLGEFNGNVFDTAIWSLVHEMRISIVFPLIALCVIRLRPLYNLGIAAILSVVGVGATVFYPPAYNTNFLMTLHYASMFFVGALLARYIDVISSWVNNMGGLRQVILFIFGIVAYTYSYLLIQIDIIHKGNVDDWAITIGSSIFIVMALSDTFVSRLLLTRIPKFLGKISYSLYLYHAIILFALMYTLYGKLSVPLILGLALLLSIFVSVISYYWIEQPAISLGKKLTSQNLVQPGNLNPNCTQ